MLDSGSYQQVGARSLGLTLESLFERCIPEPNSGCWIWLGACNHKGYGHLKHRGLQVKAHRLAYEFVHGPIAAGLLACHHCDVPSCINPAHVFVGTSKENTADAKRKGRMVRRGALSATHCRHGHPRINISGRWTHCRACERLRYHARVRAGTFKRYR